MVDSSLNRNKSFKEMENELNNLFRKKKEINQNLKILMREEKINTDK